MRGPRERGIVILAVARALDAAYEWHQHVRVGLPEEPIPRRSPPSAPTTGGRSRGATALVEFATDFATGSLDVPTPEAFVDYFDERTAVGTGVLVGATRSSD